MHWLLTLDCPVPPSLTPSLPVTLPRLLSSPPPTPHSSLGSPSVRAPRKGEIESDTLTLLLLRFYTAVIGNVRIAQSRHLTSVLAWVLFECMQQHRRTFSDFDALFAPAAEVFSSATDTRYSNSRWTASKILYFRRDCRRSLLGTSRISVLCSISCTVLWEHSSLSLSFCLALSLSSCCLSPATCTPQLGVSLFQWLSHSAQCTEPKCPSPNPPNPIVVSPPRGSEKHSPGFNTFNQWTEPSQLPTEVPTRHKQ